MQRPSVHRACLMGDWRIDMPDAPAADAAIAVCRARSSAVLEVRHSVWGVEVRTSSADAAELIAHSYMGPTHALAA